MPGNDSIPMQIIQRKSKDAELAQNVCVELQSHAIPNWYDEDGERVTSAVIVATTLSVEPKKDSKTTLDTRLIERVWWDSGSEVR